VIDDKNKGNSDEYYAVGSDSVARDAQGKPLYVVENNIIYLADPAAAPAGKKLEGFQNYTASKWYDDYGEW
jgi:hypothetical protein